MIKSYLRSTISQDRVSNLVILSIENDILDIASSFYIHHKFHEWIKIVSHSIFFRKKFKNLFLLLRRSCIPWKVIPTGNASKTSPVDQQVGQMRLLSCSERKGNLDNKYLSCSLNSRRAATHSCKNLHQKFLIEI